MRIVLAIAALAATALVCAQQAGFTRHMLQDQNMSVADRHAVQVVAEFAPGVAAGKHTHPGEELGYVLEGTLQLEVAGQPPRTLKAGDAFFIPSGTVHDGKNIGGGPAKVLATYIVEKGKPVASPAK
jgi:quercetin dioxygenase-like cupin family protein